MELQEIIQKLQTLRQDQKVTLVKLQMDDGSVRLIAGHPLEFTTNEGTQEL
jgi:hypothetical protein